MLVWGGYFLIFEKPKPCYVGPKAESELNHPLYFEEKKNIYIFMVRVHSYEHLHYRTELAAK